MPRNLRGNRPCKWPLRDRKRVLDPVGRMVPAALVCRSQKQAAGDAGSVGSSHSSAAHGSEILDLKLN